jgi:biopolymer transport protein ExbD
MAETETKTPFDTGGKKKARIEIIPLIDVIFFLLATFVLFTLSLNKIQSQESKLPTPAKDTPKSEPPAVIQVSDGDSVFFNRDITTISELTHHVTQYKNSSISGGVVPKVLVTGDDRAKYGRLIQALDIAVTAGIERENISFETAYRPSGR